MDTDKKAILQDVRKFKREYYEDLDYEYWLDKLVKLSNRLERLKNPKKQSRVVFELYHTYLQLLEMLFINAYALHRREVNFPSAIFINNTNLQAFISKHFLRKTKLSQWFLKTYILSLHEDKSDDKIRMYESLLMECAKDYIDNYQLLNAEKHGGRAAAFVGDSHIGFQGADGKMHKLTDGDSTIIYSSKEKDPKFGTGTIIFRRRIVFKRERIFSKALYIGSLLQNIRVMALKSLGDTSKQKYMYFTYEKEAWRKTFGGFSNKEPLFSLAKPTKQSPVPKQGQK